MKTANMGNRVRVGVLLTMFVVATLMLVMTHANPALGSTYTLVADDVGKTIKDTRRHDRQDRNR